MKQASGSLTMRAAADPGDDPKDDNPRGTMTRPSTSCARVTTKVLDLTPVGFDAIKVSMKMEILKDLFEGSWRSGKLSKHPSG